AAGRTLIARFLDCGARYWSGTLVWQVGADRRAMLTRRAAADDGATDRRGTTEVRFAALLIATGAQERPWAIPGWTLPGVMGVGAAQTLMKASALVPGPDTVLVGSGPLLWLYAAQLVAAGRGVQALVDTTPRDANRRALPHLPGALRALEQLRKGLGMMRTVRRAGIPIHRGAHDVAVQGATHAEGLRFRVGKDTITLATSQVLLHQGVIPATNLGRASGCAHHWNDTQACWQPTVDGAGRSSVAHVWIAGDGAGIGGAALAQIAGERAALDIAMMLGRSDVGLRAREGAAVRRRAARHAALRPLLDVLYTPPQTVRLPADDVIVCRCEEVSAGEIRRIARLGCTGPNQMKAFSRCGMGPCQGRQCGTLVTELLAHTQGRPPADVGYYRIRAPVKPVTVAEIAAGWPADEWFERGDFPS
ncbi:MAG: NAD(P)/FAD-dependent oxidoreductase, partial [Janthinobacterium lividum]